MDGENTSNTVSISCNTNLLLPPPPSSIKPSDSSTELDVFCACGAISNVGYYNGGWDEMMMTATSACIQSKKGSGQEAMSDGE